MAVHRHVGLATKIVVGAAVLCLAGGAASASGGAAAASPLTAEMQHLQARWGTWTVRSVQAIPGSHVILVGTRDRQLLRSKTPRRDLGSTYPVVVMFVSAPDVVRTPTDNKCASAGNVPMLEDSRN